MPDFTFELITPDQATAFGGSDTLVFTSQFATFTNISYQPPQPVRDLHQYLIPTAAEADSGIPLSGEQ